MTQRMLSGYRDHKQAQFCTSPSVCTSPASQAAQSLSNTAAAVKEGLPTCAAALHDLLVCHPTSPIKHALPPCPTLDCQARLTHPPSSPPTLSPSKTQNPAHTVITVGKLLEAI
jgi:hypothetical protein